MSKKTEQAIVMAAIAWTRDYENYVYPRIWDRPTDRRLAKACHAHAKATKEKRK